MVICFRDNQDPNFLCGLDADHAGDCVRLEETEHGKQLIEFTRKLTSEGRTIRKREDWDTGAMAEFIMGGDSVPDCFLDEGELAARRAARRAKMN